MKYIN